MDERDEDLPADVAPYVVLELGGGPIQIVFKPGHAKDGGHKYKLVFSWTTRMFHQHSYLGYGLKNAQESMHRLVEVHGPGVHTASSMQTHAKDIQSLSSSGSHKGNQGYQQLRGVVCEQKPCSFDPFSARYIPDIVLLLRLCYSLMGPSAGSHPALTISMYCLSRSRSARGLQRYLDRTELGCCLSATISLSSTSI
ncbi:hypothetical protein J3A83DRAFT_159449 [Scleroderma citrinum]